MQKWEYISIRQTSGFAGMMGGVYYILPNGEEEKYSDGDHEGRNIHELLNFYGKEGFELVEAVSTFTNLTVYQKIWVMKRLKPEE